MLEIPLEPEIGRLLADIAARVGEAPATIAQKALLAYLEDLEDQALAAEAWKAFDPSTAISSEEMLRELGAAD